MKTSGLQLFFVTLLLAISWKVQAQCDSTFLGSDPLLCQGQTIILDAGEGYLSYLWSTGATSQTIFVSDTGNYWCTVELVDSSNYVINGDFSLGNYGFQSDYTYNPSSVYTEGTYAVTNNPYFVHPDFAACGDHTNGAGKMMVINGAPYPDQNVWYEAIPVSPNTDYHYSGWFTSVHFDNPAVLELSINGEAIQEINLSNATCLWENFFAVWNSGSNTTIELQIVNQNTVLNGNDFAIDDISLYEVCIVADTVHVSWAPNPEVNFGPDTAFCEGDSLILLPGTFETYVWQDGSSSPYFVVNESGQYWVEVSNSYGCSGGDTIQVEVLPAPDIELGNDTTLCDGESLILMPGEGYNNYFWQDNSTLSTFNVTEPGIYWVVVSDDDNCVVSDTIYVSFAPWPDVNLGEDQSACEGEELLLDAGAGYTSYTWQDNSTGSTCTATQTGLYWVTVSNECGADSDSIYITFHPKPQPDLGSDTTLCEGTIYTLETSTTFAEYLWSDGSTLPFLEVSNSGVYSVEVTNAFGCSNTAEVFVEFVSLAIDLGDPILECDGDTVFLDAGPGFVDYLWQDDYSGQVYPAVATGEYIVVATDENNCTAEGSVSVEFLETPVADLGEDLEVCIGDSLILTAPEGPWTCYWNGIAGGQTYIVTQEGNYRLTLVNQCDSVSDEVYVAAVSIPGVNLGDYRLGDPGETITLDAGSGYDQYLWQDGSAGQLFEVTENTANPDNIYTVEVWLGPCKSGDSVLVEFFEAWVPEVITPNGDGKNDLFLPDPERWEGIRQHHITVFNRWGEKIWESSDFENGWDGKRNGKPVADGTYFWVLEAEYGKDGLKKVMKGSLTILGE